MIVKSDWVTTGVGGLSDRVERVQNEEMGDTINNVEGTVHTENELCGGCVSICVCAWLRYRQVMMLWIRSKK